MAFNVREDTAVGSIIGTVRASDDDSADILSHDLDPTDADSSSFNINIATGVVTLAAKLNHERPVGDGGETYEFTVRAFDPSNGTDTHGHNGHGAGR